MKTKLLLILVTLFFVNSYSQERCGTMKNLEEQIKKDPSIKERMLQIEQQNQKWIEKNRLEFKKHDEIELDKSESVVFKSTMSINNFCGYNNTYFTSITAPIILNSISSPSTNCTYGGEYVRVNNLIAGRTYRISTIGNNNFDTQITIYPAGGGSAVAFNDDWQGSLQSEIYFTPIYSGNYDVLINEYNCISNSVCASLQIELWNLPRAVITIPVVVHVIHKGEAVGIGTNISDTQIQSQINVLNEDFRRLNSDILSVPAPFRGVSFDPLIQFCLAQQKPDGTATNGITRRLEPTQLELSNQGFPSEFQCMNQLAVEYIKTVTIWNRDKYLNLWVSDLNQLPSESGCGVTSNLLGYAQFPGLGGINSTIPAHLTDGVWVKYSAFGNVGNIQPIFNLGRTATHEIGHWLDLRHIWGDENSCAADDGIIDTPLQTVYSSGCNIFPKIDTCSPAYPGIMFQNHMDYSDDSCRSLFTYGQCVRMDSALFNQRVGLLTSTGCMPGTLGLNNFKIENIILYPNPTNSKVNIKSESKFDYVEIYNVLGQKISSNTISENQEIDLNDFPTGIYILKMSNEETTKSVKVVKQ